MEPTLSCSRQYTNIPGQEIALEICVHWRNSKRQKTTLTSLRFCAFDRFVEPNTVILRFLFSRNVRPLSLCFSKSCIRIPGEQECRKSEEGDSYTQSSCRFEARNGFEKHGHDMAKYQKLQRVYCGQVWRVCLLRRLLSLRCIFHLL